MESEEVIRLNKQVYVGENIQYLFGQLGLLIGQRAMMAKDMLDLEGRFLNPGEAKILMDEAHNYIEHQIKELLLLNKR